MSLASRVLRSRVFTVLAVLGIAWSVQAGGADKESRKEAKRAARSEMSGVVSAVERGEGTITIRLENGVAVSAPDQKITVRDFRAAAVAAARMETTAQGSQAPARRFQAAELTAVQVGSRVMVRQKMGKDGAVKRVVIRLVD